MALKGVAFVDRSITGLGVLDVTIDGLVLAESAPGVDVGPLRDSAGAEFSVSGQVS